MRLIISPAKKMKVDTDSFPCHRLPAFLPQTQEILARLQRLSGQELKSLWKCSDKIALLNQQRLACMDLHRRFYIWILTKLSQRSPSKKAVRRWSCTCSN